MATKVAAKKVPAKPAVVPAKVVTRPAAKAALKPSPLMEELVKATGCKMKAGEDPQEFATRLCTAVSELDDEKFGKLSEKAQAWFNKAAESINKGKAVELGSEVPAATPSAAKAPAAKAPVAKAPVENKEFPNLSEYTKQRPSGTGFKMRLAVVRDPAITFEAACKKAKLEAEVGSHAWNEWNYTRQVMELHAYVAAGN